jgi:hypothetical protein
VNHHPHHDRPHARVGESVATSRETSETPTALEMGEEIVDLSVGFGVAAMPLLGLALPGILLVVVPIVLLLVAAALPVVAVGALLTPPYLLVRKVRRRRHAPRHDDGRRSARIEREAKAAA